jgi:hypothetical protein
LRRFFFFFGFAGALVAGLVDAASGDGDATAGRGLAFTEVGVAFAGGSVVPTIDSGSGAGISSQDACVEAGEGAAAGSCFGAPFMGRTALGGAESVFSAPLAAPVNAERTLK